jgi:hypothetical protein
MSILKKIRSIFSKNHPTHWSDFATAVKGKYSYINHETVTFQHRNFTISIDEYTHYAVVGTKAYEEQYIRAMAQLPTRDDFVFKLTSQGMLENIRKLLGAKEIIIGDKQFDRQYLIEGNSEQTIQLIFSNTVIQQKLKDTACFHFEYSANEGVFDEKVTDGHQLLYFLSKEPVESTEVLEKIATLFCLTIDELLKFASLKQKV